ncbi:hypothetical protein DNTS_029621 [Danionella cerebrum]|uniref:SET domain-containing protein n=1 Tax=Danionella cerebrum TaxID=2873325 RepID=A0A553N5R7_9TELE|nr:hypothetical protein DNTS_029621 [Danionella translucida]
MPPRVSPLKDACHHVGLKTDKTWKLEVKFINAVKGRGLFAVRPFCKGDFVVEYRGDLVDEAEAERRRRVYHTSCAAFFFLFKWRGKMELCAKVCHPVKGSNPAVMSEKETEEASCPLDTPQQMELCAKVCHPVKGSNPAVMSEKETEEASCPLDTPQQMDLCAKVCHPVKGSNPAVMSEKETEEASCPLDTPQQMKDACLEGTELYDSTSASGDDDEYVPYSCTDSEESDTSLDISPEKRQCLYPLLKSGSEVPKELSLYHTMTKAVKPPAEETVDGVVENENSTVKKDKRPSIEPGTTSKASPVGYSSKGRATQKRVPWQKSEVMAVERQMNKFIRSCTVPTKRDCEKCLRAEPETLSNRNWKNLKFYVYNRITALKKKMHPK